MRHCTSQPLSCIFSLREEQTYLHFQSRGSEITLHFSTHKIQIFEEPSSPAPDSRPSLVYLFRKLLFPWRTRIEGYNKKLHSSVRSLWRKSGDKSEISAPSSPLFFIGNYFHEFIKRYRAVWRNEPFFPIPRIGVMRSCVAKIKYDFPCKLRLRALVFNSPDSRIAKPPIFLKKKKRYRAQWKIPKNAKGIYRGNKFGDTISNRPPAARDKINFARPQCKPRWWIFSSPWANNQPLTGMQDNLFRIYANLLSRLGENPFFRKISTLVV